MLCLMDEGRKRVLLIAASILAARRLASWNGRPSPALEAAFSGVVRLAERILAKIDANGPYSEYERGKVRA